MAAVTQLYPDSVTFLAARKAQQLRAQLRFKVGMLGLCKDMRYSYGLRLIHRYIRIIWYSVVQGNLGIAVYRVSGYYPDTGVWGLGFARSRGPFGKPYNDSMMTIVF